MHEKMLIGMIVLVPVVIWLACQGLGCVTAQGNRNALKHPQNALLFTTILCVGLFNLFAMIKFFINPWSGAGCGLNYQNYHASFKGVVTAIQRKPVSIWLDTTRLSDRIYDIDRFDVKVTDTFFGPPLPVRHLTVKYQPYGVNKDSLFVGKVVHLHAYYDGDALGV